MPAKSQMKKVVVGEFDAFAMRNQKLILFKKVSFSWDWGAMQNSFPWQAINIGVYPL